MRQNREEKERKKQRLSSEMLKRKQTKGSGSQAPAPEEESERGSPVERLRERSREGRKETNRKPSTRTGKVGMGNQVGSNGESQEAKAEGRTGEATVRRKREEKGKEEQRLSSQNPKLRRTKECRNSGGQKAERKRC